MLPNREVHEQRTTTGLRFLSCSCYPGLAFSEDLVDSVDLQIYVCSAPSGVPPQSVSYVLNKHCQANFTRGEIDQRMESRTDVQEKGLHGLGEVQAPRRSKRQEHGARTQAQQSRKPKQECARHVQEHGTSSRTRSKTNVAEQASELDNDTVRRARSPPRPHRKTAWMAS